ncbi:MAG: TOBE domain-containing protein [Shinella sp.]|nr:TOBE domain-containing protein [Shinella sp.]MCW5710564.1 TOBE domain-containing protein [Shinella sp.]
MSMQESLGFSDAVYGLGAGLFFLTYLIFEVPSNAYLGNLSTYFVDVGGAKPVSVQMTNSQRIQMRRFTYNDPVWVSWHPADGLLLDA